MLRPLLFTLFMTASLVSCTSNASISPVSLRSQAILPPGAINNPCNTMGSEAILPPGHTPTRPKPCGCNENASTNGLIPPGQPHGKPAC
jgi:hypothetical protein